MLFQVQRNGDSGSARVTGSTSFSSLDQGSGYCRSVRELSGTVAPNVHDIARLAPARASSRPFRTVLIAMPVARATRATPPQPMA